MADPATQARPADSDLIAASCAGDVRAFEQLYRRHHARIYALCWRLCGHDTQQAEDTLQETFIQAWRKLSGFRGDAALTTWLHRLAVNIVLAERRLGSAKLRRLSEAMPDDLPAAKLAGTAAESHADQDLESVIACLPPRARLVLVLHELHGYSHGEIADMSGMAEGTSRAQLNRARRLMRQHLQQDLAIHERGQEVTPHV